MAEGRDLEQTWSHDGHKRLMTENTTLTELANDLAAARTACAA